MKDNIIFVAMYCCIYQSKFRANLLRYKYSMFHGKNLFRIRFYIFTRSENF